MADPARRQSRPDRSPMTTQPGCQSSPGTTPCGCHRGGSPARSGPSRPPTGRWSASPATRRCYGRRQRRRSSCPACGSPSGGTEPALVSPADALAGHVTEFAKILTGLHSDRLDDWITAVEADDQPDLHSFARGIKHDHQAVLNGLTMPWSSGVVEGNVNRLKMIKRQMYGRATFPLLRKRVLLC